MAVWSTDFGDIPIGETITAHGWLFNPDGWAQETQAHPVAISDASAPVSDRYVSVTSASNTSHEFSAWQPPDAPTYTGRQQVCVVVSRSHADGIQLGASGRGTGNRASKTGVAGMLRNDTTRIRWMEFSSGAATSSSTDVTHGITDANDWVTLVLDLDGGTLRVKAWEFGTTEPGAYQLVDTTTITQAGWPGIFCHMFLTSRTSRWGFFSYGTDGDTAPRPVVATAPWTLTTNTVGQGTVTKDPDQVDYAEGTSVTLTATPATGWLFDRWSGSLTGTTNPATVEMTANKTVTATFVEEAAPSNLAGVQVEAVSLTWNDDGGPYTVRRGGVIVASGLTSNAYLESLSPGTYSYTVEGSSGVESAATEVTVVEGGGGVFYLRPDGLDGWTA